MSRLSDLGLYFDLTGLFKPPYIRKNGFAHQYARDLTERVKSRAHRTLQVRNTDFGGEGWGEQAGVRLFTCQWGMERLGEGWGLWAGGGGGGAVMELGGGWVGAGIGVGRLLGKVGGGGVSGMVGSLCWRRSRGSCHEGVGG